MSFFHQIEVFIGSYVDKVPLELFVSLGAFVEEIIAPIPSPFIMTTAGTIASAQQQPLLFLLWLALIGSMGKTLGAWVLYFLADKSEDFLVGRFGNFLGVSHEQVESIGKRLDRSWKDVIILTAIRSLPVLPSAPISVVCGVLKIDLRTYLSATFLGITLRSLIFLYFGYAGLETFKTLMGGLKTAESVAQILMFLAVGALILWAYRRRSKEPS